MKKLLLALLFAVAAPAKAVTYSTYTGSMTIVSVAGEAWYSDPIQLGTGTVNVSISGGTGTVTAIQFYGGGSHLTGVVGTGVSGGAQYNIPYWTSATAIGQSHMWDQNSPVVTTSMTVNGNGFTVGGSTFVVTASSIGVGTSSPAELLDVNGGAQFGYGAVKSTFSWTTGSLTLPKATNANFVAYSSITTSGGVFGNGSGLTGLTAANLSGLVAVANGGTGNSAVPGNGGIFIGGGAAGISTGTLTQGANITITNANGAITIAASGAGGDTGTSSTTANAFSQGSTSARTLGACVNGSTLTITMNGTNPVEIAFVGAQCDDTGSESAWVAALVNGQFIKGATTTLGNSGFTNPTGVTGIGNNVSFTLLTPPQTASTNVSVCITIAANGGATYLGSACNITPGANLTIKEVK